MIDKRIEKWGVKVRIRNIRKSEVKEDRPNV